MRRPDSRSALAGVVLLAIWTGFGALVAAIARLDPGRIPLAIYVPGVAAMLAFAVGLLASRRWESVWKRGFLPTVPVPGWLWVAGALLAAVSVVLSVAVRVPPRGVLWLGLGCAGASYAAVTVLGAAAPTVDLDWLQRTLSVPSWLVLGAAAAVVTAVVIGVVVQGALLTAVFLLALLLFAFHVWFVLPLSLYHAVGSDSGATRPLGTDGGSGAGVESDGGSGASPESAAGTAPGVEANGGSIEGSSLPPVTVLVPAFDEEGLIGDCVESILASDYPSSLLEVVVIDDGSTDGTYEEAAQYRDRGVRVLHRENGGKHAALNMGLQCTSSPIVATVDADSRPLPDAIRRSVRELDANPRLGALSASVLAKTGGILDRLQHVEYALSNTNRRAYSVFGAVPVVPGCLGVYRREALEDVWGYDPDTVTEDFDLTVKLLRNGWDVRHGPSAVETVVPGGLRSLWRQRLRWYRGGLETLRKHRDVFREPRYRYLHALSMPTRLASQLFGPVASFAILGAVLWGFLTGPSTYLLVVVGIFLALTTLITLFSLVLEDEPLSYVIYAPLLFVGYKHFVDATVGVGTVRAFCADQRW